MDKRDIYIAIMVADAKGKSLYLSVGEVRQLAGDEAIRAAALNGLDETEWPTDKFAGPDWEEIKPRRKRTHANLMCIAPEDRHS